MLFEYGIFPEVLCGDCDPRSEIYLQFLHEILKREGVVRDFHSGAWRIFLARQNMLPLQKEVLESLLKQQRLLPALPELKNAPVDHAEWHIEIKASVNRKPVNALISRTPVKEREFRTSVVPLEAIYESPIFDAGHSIRVVRTKAAYVETLKLFFSTSSWIMVMDSYLDPDGVIGDLLLFCDRRRSPHIELHLPETKGSGKARYVVSEKEWKVAFASLNRRLSQAGLRAKVFLWDGFHDRYLFSNLTGISLPHGFAVSSRNPSRTTWTRLSSKDREDVQREFEPNSQRHLLKGVFEIGREQ